MAMQSFVTDQRKKDKSPVVSPPPTARTEEKQNAPTSQGKLAPSRLAKFSLDPGQKGPPAKEPVLERPPIPSTSAVKKAETGQPRLIAKRPLPKPPTGSSTPAPSLVPRPGSPQPRLDTSSLPPPTAVPVSPMKTTSSLGAKEEQSMESPVPASPNGQVDPLIQQFNTTSARQGGGVLMRGVDSWSEMDAFLGSVPGPKATEEELMQREYKLEKYSYIRGDTDMSPFRMREAGFLVDWNPIHGNLHHIDDPNDRKNRRPAVYIEDAQTNAKERPYTARMLKKNKDYVASTLDNMLAEQHTLKKRSPNVTGWNEVDMMTASPDAYRGMFFATPNRKKETYEQIFTAEKKDELATKWFQSTGQTSLKIYRYTHREQPEYADKEGRAAARDQLGKPGASALEFVEEVKYKPVNGNNALSSPVASTKSPEPSRMVAKPNDNNAPRSPVASTKSSEPSFSLSPVKGPGASKPSGVVVEEKKPTK